MEEKRTERSRRPFVLMLLESTSLLRAGDKDGTTQKILSSLSKATRETDIKGWYKAGSVVGIIFTEIGAFDSKSISNTLSAKIGRLLSLVLTAEQVGKINLSFYIFPEDLNEGGNRRSNELTFYSGSAPSGNAKKASLVAKRFLDIVGALFALIIGAPIFFAIALAIRATSKGPVLFRQKRVGQYGRGFTFLKFRSMYAENDHGIHRDYVQRFIAGSIDSERMSDDQQSIYKLTDDPRVTSVGGFLRKTSLDELPQFLNVLLGEMSLVGPRPPLPYEVECYDIWHKRRLQEVKPGITGLWQVTGRSRSKFDEMVRLDLQYARSWSLWLDLKILWRTPSAVLTGDGAC